MTKYDAIVIGGGAAGLMAAGKAAENGCKVLVFDKNEKLARKVRITGKGRCNVCNNCSTEQCIANIPGNGRFMYSALNTFAPEDTMDFFENLGVPLKTERGNRVFPVSDNANDIADSLVNWIKSLSVEINQHAVEGVIVENNEIKGVKSRGKIYYCDKVLIATGGASYKATGSNGDGYKFARKLGHKIVEPRPSLVALCCKESFCADMQGLSLKNCGLKLFEDKKQIFEDFGELLFTHFGISGPIVLSASSHMRKQSKYHIELDLKPALSFEQLDKRFLRDFTNFSNKNFENYLPELLPKKLIPVIINMCRINPDTKCHSITREERHKLIECLKNFKTEIVGFRSLNEAIVTSGGVSIKEINPKTMESKIISGLYFAGEVIDVDAYTGGFNLQIAFSTGFLAGNNMAYS